MLRLYETTLLPLRMLAGLLAWRHRSGDRAEEWLQRTGRGLPTVAEGSIWIHGSSVGEARIAGGLAAAIRERSPATGVVVSAFTPTGRAALPTPPAIDGAFFAPLDFRAFIDRTFERLRPARLVLIETELWPLLLDGARRRQLPAVIVNGRLSAHRMRRYHRLRPIFGPLLGSLTAVGAQSLADAERFVELGVPPSRVSCTGNVKYDLAPPLVDTAELRRELGLDAQRPVLVAGSTRRGEEEPVVRAYQVARTVHDRLLLILAPRHPDRADEVEQLCRAADLAVVRYSRAAAGAASHADVLLVDTLGELGRLWALATMAFVGGSLVPFGGHNLLEPAALGVPVLFGPHTELVAETAATLIEAGAARRVADADDLARALSDLLSDGAQRQRMAESARAVIEGSRGAMASSVELALGDAP